MNVRINWGLIHTVDPYTPKTGCVWAWCGAYLGLCALNGRIVEEPATCLWCVVGRHL